MRETNIIFALAMTLTVLGALWLSAFLTKRAIHQVIGTFCRHNALSFWQARTIDELGLTPPIFCKGSSICAIINRSPLNFSSREAL